MPLTRRMLHMPLMHQAAKDHLSAPPVDVTVDFDSGIQGLAALEGAAYRLIGTATCRIDRVGDRYVCRLTPAANPPSAVALGAEALKERFLNLVVDENLRTRVAQKTEGIRNVILALAFGSLAATRSDAG